MTDILHKLAAVSHLQAQDAATDLNKLADRQKEKVYEKRAVRDVQEYYDKVMSDDVVTFDELKTLHDMRSEIGSTDRPSGTRTAAFATSPTPTAPRGPSTRTTSARTAMAATKASRSRSASTTTARKRKPRR